MTRLKNVAVPSGNILVVLLFFFRERDHSLIEIPYWILVLWRRAYYINRLKSPRMRERHFEANGKKQAILLIERCVCFLFYAYISIERAIGVMMKRRREMHNNKKKKSPFHWMHCREMLYNTVRRRSEIQSIGLVLLAEFEGNVQRRNSWPRTINGTGDFSSILTLSAAYVQRLHHNDLSSVAANERREFSLSLLPPLMSTDTNGREDNSTDTLRSSTLYLSPQVETTCFF